MSQKAHVTDAETGNPVYNASVSNSKNKHGTLTNENGQALLDKFGDQDTIHFQHAAYQTVSLTKEQLKTRGYKVELKIASFILPPVVTSASRSMEKIKEVPYKIDVLSSKNIEQLNPQTSADLLEGSGNVLIQKSQGGGGSPIIRGFEANKVLIVVDGVRLNNAIYRSGHLQNVITIDNSILDRAEVVYGPSSVIYGSDALGGVMHFYTKDPKLSSIDTMANVKFNGYARYSTINNEHTTHADVNIGFKKLGFLTSYTTSKFDDLKSGTVRNHGYADFGKVFHYADTANGVDTMIANPDPNVQKFSGYTQFDLLQKVYYRINDSTNLTLNIQRSTSGNVPRFSSLNDYRNGVLRFAEWNYGPQNRLLTSLRLRKLSDGFLYNIMSLTAAYQRIDEDRYTRRFGSDTRTIQEEDIRVYSINLDLVKKIRDMHRINYGIEITHNDVQSLALSLTKGQDIVDPAATRYPDGGSIMQTYAFYMTDKVRLGRRVSLLLGARNNISRLRSTFNDTSFVKLPFDIISLLNVQLTGSASLVYNPTEDWKINLIGATGFRSPNVDDVGKVREKDGFTTVPNNNLKAEHAYNGELGFTRFFNDQKFVISGAGFYTLLYNAIVRRDFQLNGQDSLIYEGETTKIQANQNSSNAVIYGTNIDLIGKLSTHFSIKGSFNYTYGWDRTTDLPLAHIPPVFGRAGVQYSAEKISAGLAIKYNGWKRIKDYATSGEDNEDEATVDGTPAWYVIDANASYKFKKYMQLQVGLNNILDHHYKPFSSGISGPGRNLSVTFRIGI